LKSCQWPSAAFERVPFKSYRREGRGELRVQFGKALDEVKSFLSKAAKIFYYKLK
jgi:hypothetical protein